MSSYQLFDLTDDNEVEKPLQKSPSRKESRKRKKESATTTTTTVLEEQEESTSPCNESKRRRTSSWLSTFLSKKRDLDVPEPPEVLCADITYLREFNEQFEPKSSSSLARTTDIVDEASDNDVDDDDNLVDRKSENNDDDVDHPAQEQPLVTGKLRIYNLPYAVTIDTIMGAGRNRGFEFMHVKLLIDPKTGLSMGSADVELDASIDTEAAVQALQGVEVSGRLIRLR